MKVAHLGPAGTFSDEALRIAVGERSYEADPRATIHEAIMAVECGEAERGFVPFENSIEGTVRPTLDALAFDADGVRIVGEFDHEVHQALIAREGVSVDDVEVVVSHPQPLAQCASFLRESLPRAEVRAVNSTADAVRQVAASDAPWAALGSVAAAELHGCAVLREGVEDAADNVTRFAWIAPAGAALPDPDADAAWRTTLVFSELGEDHPGALVDALAELSNRGINMTRIESRPRRIELGRYMFFIDFDGSTEDDVVAEGIEALRSKAESVRILGSYQVGGPPPLP
jgi:prephenate dehydratase